LLIETTDQLRTGIEAAARRAELTRVAVAFHDLGGGQRFSFEGEQLFHAASTFKAAVLLALLREVMMGRVQLDDKLQVRNRFLGLTDGVPFRVQRDRDADAKVHRALGRSLSMRELAHAMITRSSNLATNLLLDFLTPALVQETMAAAGIGGLIVRRGVEDIVAHEQGINNEASAEGLVALFLAFLREDLLSSALQQEAIQILLEQEFGNMIPARLPRGVKVAHKTGEISTHAHDAGLVMVDGAPPYAVAILTESEPGSERRQTAVAEISELVFRHLREGKA
jgi:beta-lactamase class A